MELPKLPVDRNWFKQLAFDSDRLYEKYEGLLEIGIQAKKIVNFGCDSGIEPFALLWIFDAKEVVVVEINEEHINRFRTRLASIQSDNPQCMHGRTISPIVADMSNPVEHLLPEYFDLAYCANVLYYMKIDQSDFERVQSAINEMARVVRPGGWIVAYEPKMDVKSDLFRLGPTKFDRNKPLNDASDISELFDAAGLIRSSDDPLVPYLYLYHKPASN